jgi:hypothetical protein
VLVGQRRLVAERLRVGAQSNRKARRGKGKSDPSDAHLAVLAALCLDADRLPIPRADGDREALALAAVGIPRS